LLGLTAQEIFAIESQRRERTGMGGLAIQIHGIVVM
jgi:hypothetical protein